MNSLGPLSTGAWGAFCWGCRHNESNAAGARVEQVHDLLVASPGRAPADKAAQAAGPVVRRRRPDRHAPALGPATTHSHRSAANAVTRRTGLHAAVLSLGLLQHAGAIQPPKRLKCSVMRSKLCISACHTSVLEVCTEASPDPAHSARTCSCACGGKCPGRSSCQG